MSLFLIFELSWPMFGKVYVNFVLECTRLNVQERWAVADRLRSLNDRFTTQTCRTCILPRTAGDSRQLSVTINNCQCLLSYNLLGWVLQLKS